MSVKIKDLVVASTATLAGNNILSTADKGVASGVATLDGSVLVPFAQLPTGTTASTVAIGNHTHAGSGNYQTVQDAGVDQANRLKLNFADSTLITFATTDNSGANSTDVTATLVTNPTIAGNLTVTGTLTVNGTTTTVNATTVTVDDPIFTLGGDTAPGADDNKDRGIEFRWHNGTSAQTGFFGFDDSTGFFTFIPSGTNTAEVYSGTLGVIDALRITGSAATLTTARAITATGDASWTVNFDGSAAASATLTLATVNSNVGTFGDTITVPGITVNAKGLITAVTSNTIRSGTTAQTGVLQITDSTASTSITTAASPNSVKSAFDLATAALPKAGGTMTGAIVLKAGAAGAGAGPIYFTPAGAALLTTPVAGAMEIDSSGVLYYTPAGTRKTVAFLDSSITGSAATLTTSRNFSITGKGTAAAVGFTGAADVALNITALAPSETEVTTALANGYGNVVSFTPGTISLTTAYASVTGIAGTALGTGTHYMQIKFTDGTNTIVYSGIMSWYGTADVATTGTQEIVLHQAGKAPGTAQVFARVLMDTTGTQCRLQVAGSAAMTMTTPTFRFRRIFD